MSCKNSEDYTWCTQFPARDSLEFQPNNKTLLKISAKLSVMMLLLMLMLMIIFLMMLMTIWAAMIRMMLTSVEQVANSLRRDRYLKHQPLQIQPMTHISNTNTSDINTTTTTNTNMNIKPNNDLHLT